MERIVWTNYDYVFSLDCRLNKLQWHKYTTILDYGMARTYFDLLNIKKHIVAQDFRW